MDRKLGNAVMRIAALVALEQMGIKVPRPCTCHPDDNPPRPCPQKYALEDCRAAAALSREGGRSGE